MTGIIRSGLALGSAIAAACLAVGLTGCPGRCGASTGTAPGGGSTATGEPAAASAGPSELALAGLSAADRALVDRAQDAMRSAQMRLGSRLQAAMAEKGPAGAIGVCADEAPLLTAEVATAKRLELGRTSHRLRSPANAPRDWVQPWLAAHPPEELAPLAVFDLGPKLGVIQPIPTQELCLRCHGDPSTMPEDLRTALAARYPDDRATGFAAGHMRGVFWVEVAREGR